MKSIFILFIVSLMSNAITFGQGQVNFANLANGLNVPVKDYDGISLLPTAGNLYRADLFYGPTGSTAAQLTDAGLAISFSANGYFSYPSGFTIPFPIFDSSHPGSVQFQIRIWQVAAGASWASATGGASDTTQAGFYASNGGTKWFFSNQFQNTPSIGPANPAILTGLLSFSSIPEPTTLTVGGFGAIALLLLRRQKQTN